MHTSFLSYLCKIMSNNSFFCRLSQLHFVKHERKIINVLCAWFITNSHKSEYFKVGGGELLLWGFELPVCYGRKRGHG